MIQPHGGSLVNRVATGEKKQEYINKAKSLPALQLTRQQLITINNLATGLFSPLTGFMVRADYENVLANMRLADGTVWSCR